MSPKDPQSVPKHFLDRLEKIEKVDFFTFFHRFLTLPGHPRPGAFPRRPRRLVYRLLVYIEGTGLPRPRYRRGEGQNHENPRPGVEMAYGAPKGAFDGPQGPQKWSQTLFGSIGKNRKNRFFTDFWVASLGLGLPLPSPGAPGALYTDCSYI